MTIRHRWRAALAAALLALAALGGAAGPASAVNWGNCIGVITDSEQMWTQIKNPSGHRQSSVYAELYGDTNRFGPCSPGDATNQADVAQWIALSNAGDLSGRDIVQVGYVKCHDTSKPLGGRNCTDPNGVVHWDTLGYFYAFGRVHDNNCPGWGSDKDPQGVWLGSVPLVGVPPGPGYHRFQVTRSNANPAVYVWIDGTIRASIPSAQVCWVDRTDGNVRSLWSAEKHNPGSGFGGPGPVWFQNASSAADGGSLANPGWPDPCYTNGSYAYEWSCQFPFNNKMGITTTQ